jgi:RNA polymerase sigma-70 factor (ECF subfamily)
VGFGVSAPEPASGWTAGPAGRTGGGTRAGTGAATQRFLCDLRILLSIGEASGEAGRPPSRGGFDAGTEPADFERISALVELAQRGDPEAFGMLYERYVDTVYRYVYVRVGTRQTAEDLTSETFVRALRRIDSFSWQGRDIAAWFVTIARNLVIDNAKSARFRLEVATADMLDADEHVDAPETEVLQRMRDARLVEAVRTLKPEQAECLVLRFLQGLSLTECAKVLGKSEGAVKQLQLRAVRSLRRELENDVL